MNHGPAALHEGLDAVCYDASGYGAPSKRWFVAAGALQLSTRRGNQRDILL